MVQARPAFLPPACISSPVAPVPMPSSCLSQTLLALTPACILVLSVRTTNQDVIDWQAAQGCYSELDRRTFLSLLPAHARNSMPDAGDDVIYYGDGHAVSVKAEVRGTVTILSHEVCFGRVEGQRRPTGRCCASYIGPRRC